MRQLFIIFCTLILTSCDNEKISNGDVDKLVINQLENNRIEIDRIKREIKEFKLEKRTKNIALMDKLDRVHKRILSLNDSIDSLDKDIVQERAIEFINRNFNDLESFNELPLEINESIPGRLLKLRISTLEAFSIRQQRLRYDFGDEGQRIRFDHMTIKIETSKAIVKRGEKITGKLIFGAEANFKDSKKVIKKMLLNGQEISADKEGWKFEITPNVKGTGLVVFELNSEALFGDTSSVKGRHLIYIRD